jgi:hypothetical protein
MLGDDSEDLRSGVGVDLVKTDDDVFEPSAEFCNHLVEQGLRYEAGE